MPVFWCCTNSIHVEEPKTTARELGRTLLEFGCYRREYFKDKSPVTSGGCCIVKKKSFGFNKNNFIVAIRMHPVSE